MALIPILFEREASRSNPRNGAGAHLRFGHKAMIASDHRVLVSGALMQLRREAAKRKEIFLLQSLATH